jgi:hypothetical protein
MSLILKLNNYSNDERARFVAVLEIPPVDSGRKAAEVQIVNDLKGKK